MICFSMAEIRVKRLTAKAFILRWLSQRSLKVVCLTPRFSLLRLLFLSIVRLSRLSSWILTLWMSSFMSSVWFATVIALSELVVLILENVSRRWYEDGWR